MLLVSCSMSVSVYKAFAKLSGEPFQRGINDQGEKCILLLCALSYGICVMYCNVIYTFILTLLSVLYLLLVF